MDSEYTTVAKDKRVGILNVKRRVRVGYEQRRVTGLVTDTKRVGVGTQHIGDASVLQRIELVFLWHVQIFTDIAVPVVAELLRVTPLPPGHETVGEEIIGVGMTEHIQFHHQTHYMVRQRNDSTLAVLGLLTVKKCGRINI